MKNQQSSFQNSSKLAALVESHCEYLTCIRHNVSQRTEVARASLKTLDEYMKDRRLRANTQALLQLVIELAYFLYACRTYQVKPNIDVVKDLRVEESLYKNSQKRFTLVIWYRVQEEGALQQGEAMQAFIEIFTYIQEALRDYLKTGISHRELPTQELELQQSLELFYHQFELLMENKYLQDHESHFFLCLQQTALFYEQSLMYRIKNCSVMDYIKAEEARLGLLRFSKVRDQSLVVEFNKEKNKALNDQEVLAAKEREIQGNITHFFRGINPKQYFQFQVKNQKDQTNRVRFSYTIQQREKYAFQEMIQSMQGANVFRNDSKRLMQCRRPPSELEYFIEYSSQKNQICVRLYSLVLLSLSQESLIFQSNVFTFQSYNVSMELAEPRMKGMERSGKKVITFKGTSSFQAKEPPLERILLLIDITMIASKIYQPEILSQQKQSNSGSRDYQRLSTISKKINHYTKLFLKCAKKIYSE